MENLYKELRSFFANDIDLTDLFDSEAIIWIDWREYDEDVVNYFNDMMAEPIDIKTVTNGKAYGDDIVLQKGDKELLEVINGVLKDMKQSGEADKLYKKWLIGAQ